MTVNNMDVIRVTAKMAHNGGVDEIQNVFHFRVYVAAGVSDMDVHNAISLTLDGAYTNIQAQVPLTTTYTTIETWNVTQDRPMYETAWPTRTTGGGTGELMPSQCAPLVLFSTSVARSQGRKFLPFFREADMTSGVLNGTALANIADWIADILTDVVLPSGEAYVGNWNPTLARFASWVAGTAQAIVRTQRRRVRGVGS